MRACAVLAACLCLGAAPVPRERPVAPADLEGAWAYTWGGAPGVLWLHGDGAYRALHGDARVGYAGVWWVDRGRVVLIEYRTDCDGIQRDRPQRAEFEVRRRAAGFEWRGASVTVTLTKRGEG